MKEYIDAGDTYFANQLSSCRTDVLKGKILLKSALAYKGVSLPDNPTYTQIAQGIANIPAQNTSGTMTITAHFHLDGVGVNKTFTDNDTQTAWQQYNAYLNSHNTGEQVTNGSLGSNTGCYTHRYQYSHYHNHDCYSWGTCEVSQYVDPAGTRDDDYYGYIHIYNCRRVHSACGANTEEWTVEVGTTFGGTVPSGGGWTHEYQRGLICTLPQGSWDYWQKENCPYTNGQIFKIDIEY